MFVSLVLRAFARLVETRPLGGRKAGKTTFFAIFLGIS
jgi:hypothetical protein